MFLEIVLSSVSLNSFNSMAHSRQDYFNNILLNINVKKAYKQNLHLASCLQFMPPFLPPPLVSTLVKRKLSRESKLNQIFTLQKSFLHSHPLLDVVILIFLSITKTARTLFSFRCKIFYPLKSYQNTVFVCTTNCTYFKFYPGSVIL